MTTDERPAPLVEADVDLRAIAPYMPLDVVRLRDSEIAAMSSAEAFRAAVLLWCAAWHEVPAASLPNDDAVLARRAGYGREVARFRRVKVAALRGFVECSDGRLYHRVVAEKANKVWGDLQMQRERTRAATEARGAKKGPKSNGPTPRNVFHDDQRNAPRDERCSDGRDDERQETRNEVQGKERKGKERKGTSRHDVTSDVPEAWTSLCRDLASAYEDRGSLAPDTYGVTLWREANYEPAICLTVVKGILARRKTGDTPPLSYFARPLAEEHERIWAARKASQGVETAPEIDWDRILEAFVQTGGQVWLAVGKPRPGLANCPVPPETITKYRADLARLMPDAFPPLHS